MSDSLSPLPKSDQAPASLLRVAARRLARNPFTTVKLEDVATDACVSLADVTRHFPSMHTVGTSVLDHERASMHAVQERLSDCAANPLERLILAFRLVGENLAQDVIVRAGVRIASESRGSFPERRIDPFRTWEAFVTEQLAQANSRGLLRPSIDLRATVWTIVASGMGTKDLLAFHDRWVDAPGLLESAVANVVSLIARESPSQHSGADNCQSLPMHATADESIGAQIAKASRRSPSEYAN